MSQVGAAFGPIPKRVSGMIGVRGQTTKWTSTTNAYEWWDSALQGTISYKPDLNGAPGTTYVTTFAPEVLET